MTEYALLLRRVIGGADLSQEQAAAAIGEIMDGSLSAVQAAALLAALAVKGESGHEIVGAARAMRERSLRVEHTLPLVADVVGTGGDGADTINISTLAALTVAAGGIPVAKHGNRAASGSCGSADVLEAAGMCVDLSPRRAEQLLERTGFTFMFAPRYHPAMKNVGPVRRELGVRTLFNVLGPLTNPAHATHQLVGVARAEHIDLVGDALRELGVRAGAVVHAASGIDEVGGEGPTTVYAFEGNESRRWTLEPADYGIDTPVDQLRGGSVSACARAFESVLSGERSARSEVVALNAALAFCLCGKTGGMMEGLDFARTLLAEGRAGAVFAAAAALSHD